MYLSANYSTIQARLEVPRTLSFMRTINNFHHWVITCVLCNLIILDVHCWSMIAVFFQPPTLVELFSMKLSWLVDKCLFFFFCPVFYTFQQFGSIWTFLSLSKLLLLPSTVLPFPWLLSFFCMTHSSCHSLVWSSCPTRLLCYHGCTLSSTERWGWRKWGSGVTKVRRFTGCRK